MWAYGSEPLCAGPGGRHRSAWAAQAVRRSASSSASRDRRLTASGGGTLRQAISRERSTPAHGRGDHGQRRRSAPRPVSGPPRATGRGIDRGFPANCQGAGSRVGLIANRSRLSIPMGFCARRLRFEREQQRVGAARATVASEAAVHRQRRVLVQNQRTRREGLAAEGLRTRRSARKKVLDFVVQIASPISGGVTGTARRGAGAT